MSLLYCIDSSATELRAEAEHNGGRLLEWMRVGCDPLADESIVALACRNATIFGRYALRAARQVLALEDAKAEILRLNGEVTAGREALRAMMETELETDARIYVPVFDAAFRAGCWRAIRHYSLYGGALEGGVEATLDRWLDEWVKAGRK